MAERGGAGNSGLTAVAIVAIVAGGLFLCLILGVLLVFGFGFASFFAFNSGGGAIIATPTP